MKVFLFTALSLFFAPVISMGTPTAADPEVRMVCATPPLTTTYLLMETEDHFELTGINHNGVKYMPIHFGHVTMADLNYLAKKGEILNAMGNRFEINFLKSECKVSAEGWACYSSRKMRIGDLQSDGVSFVLDTRRTITKHVDYTNYRATLSVTYEREGFSSPMDYDPRDCVFR